MESIQLKFSWIKSVGFDPSVNSEIVKAMRKQISVD